LFYFFSRIQHTDGPKGEPHQKAGVSGGERGAKDGFAGRCAHQSLYVSRAVRGRLFCVTHCSYAVTEDECAKVKKRIIELTGKDDGFDRRDFNKLLKKTTIESIPREVLDRVFCTFLRSIPEYIDSAQLSADKLLSGLSIALKGSAQEKAGSTNALDRGFPFRSAVL
jgi:hypothetical protein